MRKESINMTNEKNSLRLAILGMVERNGHPYSWSAIINGDYNKEEMVKCPYAGIPAYLGQQPAEKLGIPGARATHIWTDDPADAKNVAEASYIEHIAECPEEVIGQVDAVIIATDKGFEHVKRAQYCISCSLNQHNR